MAFILKLMDCLLPVRSQNVAICPIEALADLYCLSVRHLKGL